MRPGRNIAAKTIEQFSGSLSNGSRLLRPWSTDFKETNRLWNAAHNTVSPDFTLIPREDEDVVKAVNFCRENDLVVTPRAGRHNLGGFSTVESGFVIDFREMTDVSVKLSSNQNAMTFQPGCKSGPVEKYLWDNHPGYGIMGIMEPDIGLTGAFLGVGHGFLQRYLSTGTDNIIEMNVVLANGEVVTANKYENSDLFWAIRGTHSNMGIVTSLTVKLHDIFDKKQRAEVYHAVMYFDIKYGEEIFEQLREMVNNNPFPDTICIIYEIIQENGQWVARLTYTHYVFRRQFSSDSSNSNQTDNKVEDISESMKTEAQKWSVPIEKLMDKYNGTYIVPFEWVNHYDQQVNLVALPHNKHWYTSAGFVNKDNASKVYNKLYKHFATTGTKHNECRDCSLFMLLYGGALNDRNKQFDESCDQMRAANPAGTGIEWLVMFWNIYDENGKNDEKIVKQFTRDSFNDIKGDLTCGYVNGLAYDQNNEEFVKFMYGDQLLSKLQKIKQKYDPTNLFRNNLNIRPNNQE